MTTIDNLRLKHENDNYAEIGGFDGQYSEYIPDIEPTGFPREDNYRVCDHIVPMTTIGCIIANRGKDMLALNFANANFAGGGYVIGEIEDAVGCRMLYQAGGCDPVRDYLRYIAEAEHERRA